MVGGARISPERDAERYWTTLLQHTPLGILTDLDGTLVPFAERPDAARPSSELQRLVCEVAELSGVSLVVVSGRPHLSLEELFPRPHKAWLVAEHGGWRNEKGEWESIFAIDQVAIDSLITRLRRLLGKYPAAVLERKSGSVAFHYRMIAAHRKAGLLVQLASIIEPWLEAHPEFESVPGAEVVEVRPTAARKASAVAWVRSRLGTRARLILIGEDTSDEDMLAAAREEDAPVRVGAHHGQVTTARFRLASSADVHAFFREILSLRQERSRRLSLVPSPIERNASHRSHALLILSNRLPELRSGACSSPDRKQNVGGLVSALTPVLTERKGIWFGWSGRTTSDARPSDLRIERVDGLPLAWVDFPDEWHRHYYNGFSNRALWPLFHSFPGKVSFSQRDWDSYRAANMAFAILAEQLVGKDATIWAHDYHLLLLAGFLRQRGHTGPIGFFQHIPFPGPDIFFLLPWADEILEAMSHYDLLGFHVKEYEDNFVRCLSTWARARRGGLQEWRAPRTGVFPLGILPEQFQETADDEASSEISGLLAAMGESRIVLGVDRLDYTKGIPERIDAFGRLLHDFPEWRRRVCMVQVSVPSRADVPEYADQRTRVENIVSRINGEYGEADWVPIRYLYRSYGRAQLSQLYRAADVGYVTPLRDGMNLVAKEYIAAQDPKKPGVLVLSRFAGAAAELRDAVLTNPWHPDGVARDLDYALRMPEAERVARYERLMTVVSKTTALTWAHDFLTLLSRSS